MPPTPEEKLTEAIGLSPMPVNNVWGSSTLTKRTLLTMPSGQTVYAKPIGLQGVMESGFMGEADSLTAYVGREHVRKIRGGKGQPDADSLDTTKVMKDPEALKRIVKLVDAITPLVCIEPKVLCHYEIVTDPDTKKEDTRMIPDNERICGKCGLPEECDEHHEHNGHTFQSAIYTDMIGLEDKMFLFNFAVGGLKDAAAFREESAKVVGTVADVAGLPDNTEPSGENRAERRKRPRRGGRSSSVRA